MDIKGTNVENIGSKMDHDLREKAAATEVAWTILENPQEGLKIWRIEKFKVVAIDVKSYGTFYNGDSYIILKTIKTSPSVFTYNLHFWIGSKSSQDEYGTAAYKSVELDDFLKRIPHLYRETELAMSDIFRSYFPQGLTILEGGIDSGFKHIPFNPAEMFFNNFSPLLYKIHSNTTKIIPLCSNSLTEEDSYVIDSGKVIYIYNGKSASHSEIYQCNNLSQNIRNARTVIKAHIQQRFDLEELKNDKSIFTKDSNDNSILVEHIDIPDEICNTKISDFTPYISALTLTTINNKTLNGNDSYIISHNNIKYIWIGKESNNMESKLAWDLAVRHLPLDTQVSIEREGNESLIFKSLFN